MSNNLNVRHDEEMRRLAVGLFEKGYGEGPASSLLSIPKGTVKQQLYTYRAVGWEGLLAMGSKHAKYTFEQKIGATRAVTDEGMGLSDAMSAFGIASRCVLQRWCKAYREGGAEALRPKAKGRPRGAVDKRGMPKTR